MQKREPAELADRWDARCIKKKLVMASKVFGFGVFFVCLISVLQVIHVISGNAPRTESCGMSVNI